MKLNLCRFAPLFLPALVLVLVCLAGDAGAQVASSATQGTSDGQVALTLAQGLMCDTKALLEGYVGLLLGLVLIFVGVWSLVGGGSPKVGLVTIFFGALITALPSLILSTMEGFGALMEQSGLSSGWTAPEQCSASGGNYDSGAGSGGDDPGSEDSEPDVPDQWIYH